MVENQLYVLNQDDASSSSTSQFIPIQYPEILMGNSGISNNSGIVLQQNLIEHECTSCGRFYDQLGKDALG